MWGAVPAGDLARLRVTGATIPHQIGGFSRPGQNLVTVGGGVMTDGVGRL
jgi:hypothetical protein